MLLFVDRVASYTRAIFGGMAQYGVEHGPWRFVPIVAPAALVNAIIHAKSGGIDGALARVVTQQMGRALSESNIPAVNVGRLEHVSLPSVHLDDEEVGRIAARYLLQGDAASFAFCGIPWIWYSRLRENGFVEFSLTGEKRRSFH